MILGVIVAILSGIGIYGFFIGNFILSYIALIAIFLEYIIGIITKQLKSPAITFWISIIIGIVLYINDVASIWACLAVCMCIENVIMFICGIIYMLFIHAKSHKKNNTELLNNNLINKKSIIAVSIMCICFILIVCIIYTYINSLYNKINELESEKSYLESKINNIYRDFFEMKYEADYYTNKYNFFN